MKCKKAKELLLTDYLDNQASPALRAQLDSHLKTCARCKEDKLIIDNVFSVLFQGAKVAVPKQEMWQCIKSSIVNNVPEVKSSIFFKPFLRKNIFTFATAAVLLFIFIVFQNAGNIRRESASSFFEQEADFFYNTNLYESQHVFNSVDFETAIEEWFL